jgi:hypothetical protein
MRYLRLDAEVRLFRRGDDFNDFLFGSINNLIDFLALITKLNEILLPAIELRDVLFHLVELDYVSLHFLHHQSKIGKGLRDLDVRRGSRSRRACGSRLRSGWVVRRYVGKMPRLRRERVLEVLRKKARCLGTREKDSFWTAGRTS